MPFVVPIVWAANVKVINQGLVAESLLRRVTQQSKGSEMYVLALRLFP